ncbi:N-acetylmuramoyl-L-alanine amidase [Flavonifractor plautii]|uniref:N-acetylmuramoyl-L-alanine amidase n=2 Tax=Flavonifractor plautii TaxID=292800 RepID=A0AAW6CK17_FLAPL|nr:N-acetylmuramoyl-L-alanine amidase [Flavonifractor plautii]MDB7931294.1 N-acetylmuramoyl-L-alanine amidase [Flavonifractor plautii]MDB7936244.1 N-acetylmuramoyl-L-alanine amidase [Flavonifractor plautii]MDB7941242.1 N-acetylmuramoyl-L-alanine amidase [Flavonifractor plautii]
MSKYIAVIPRAAITRAALVEAGGRSMEQVKAACGCQYILNSWFYDTITGRPVGNLKIDGTVKAAAGWNGWGLTWDKGADIRLDILPDNGGASYLSGVELLTPTRGPGKALSYSPEYGSTRGRSAVLLAGARVILYCSGDGTADAKTPEGLRDELVTIGCRYDQAANLRALGLDAGSSSNCDFGDGQRISNGKRVKGYLCIWTTEDGTEEPPEKEESMGKYKVTPSIGVNIRSGPGTGYGKVGAYPCGAVVDVLEERDGWGRTDKGWVSLAYLEAVEGPQRVTDNGIAIQTYLIDQEADNRPGGSNPCKYITIHETGNAAKGADAVAHAAYLDSDAGKRDMVSWHYTVDDHAIVQHLPDYETAYHAGDGKDGPGNTTSIGIEICVNAGGDFEAAKANAAALVRLLMEEHGISADRVVQHNHWNGKDCPKTIRATAGAWEAFLALCRGETANVSKLDTDVDTLANVGIIDQPDYWKAGNYSKDTVEALIGKTADYVREDD